MRGAHLLMHNNVDERRDDKKSWDGENRSLVEAQQVSARTSSNHFSVFPVWLPVI